MSQLNETTAILNQVLNKFEDNSSLNNVTKKQNYEALQIHIGEKEYVNYDIFQRILNICVNDMQNDMKFLVHALKVLSIILNKVKVGAYSPPPDILVPSALCVIHKINIIASIKDIGNLRDVCFKTILLYPNETLVSLVSTQEDVIVDIFKLHNYELLEFNKWVYEFLDKLLEILPKKIKVSSFMKSIVPIVLAKVIPSIMDDLENAHNGTTVHNEIHKSLILLENITNDLSDIDFYDIPQWKLFLYNLCSAKKYPDIMKVLLEKGCQDWYKLWIVFVKLLKYQVTSYVKGNGTPINAMLPIVESAFKMDQITRCRAFECWTELINIFSYETNENCIKKRLKLLLIPLKFNNVKVELTVLAKFNTWWHLINKFQYKLENFIQPILISFLHYCFGEYGSKKKNVTGDLSIDLKKYGVEALVEIIGHTDCTGCVEITRLQGKIINTKILLTNVNDWLYSLKVAFQTSLDNINEPNRVPQHVLCLLQSFLTTVSGFPNKQDKEYVMKDLLSTLTIFVKDCESNEFYSDTVFAMLLSFFMEKLNLRDIFRIRNDGKNSLYKIIKLTLDPSLKKLYEIHNTKDMMLKFQPIIKYVLHDPEGLQYALDNILTNRANDITLIFWSAFTEYLNESKKDFSEQSIIKMLRWPLESLDMFTDVKYLAKIWHTTYCAMHKKIGIGNFEEDISKILHNFDITKNSNLYFVLHGTCAVLKCGLMMENTNKYESDVQLFQTVLERIDRYEDIEEIFPTVIDTIILVLHCYTLSNNTQLIEAIISCVKNVLNLMITVFKEKSNVNKVSIIIEILLKALDVAFKSATYSKFFSTLSEIVTFYSSIYNDLSLPIFKRTLFENKEIITCNKDKIDKHSEANIEDNSEALTKKIIETSNLIIQNTKESSNETKKKAASIVNTVLENGEEFVVVKSNWKFNPKKLTENQKEKLQRKREDIPALYQDLSQSQDDINIKTWKIDSQDTTSSKSCGKSTIELKDASLILKNVPNTEVVPKIMENIFSVKENTESEISHTKSISKITKPIVIKIPKKNRITLKDRVFNNVKNLIEKSKGDTNDKNMDKTHNQTEYIPRTPSPLKLDKEIIDRAKSAPPLLLAERPSRIKRKPKKFDETLNIKGKKRRLRKDLLTNNQTLNMNLPIDNSNKCNAKENCLINETGDDVITNTNEINETQQTEGDMNIVDPMVENAKLLRVKLIKNDISKIIEKNMVIKTNPDPKLSQLDDDIEEQENNNEHQSVSKTSDSNFNAQISPATYDKNNLHVTPAKKTITKQSRIEKQLAINMTEGHPFLNTQLISNKRSTRTKISIPNNTSKKTRLTDKLNQTPLEVTSSKHVISEPQHQISIKDSIDMNFSEDVIENSQDLAITVINKTPKKLPFVCIENISLKPINQSISETEDLLDESHETIKESSVVEKPESLNTSSKLVQTEEISIQKEEFDESSILSNTIETSKDDTVLPQNKTLNQNESDLRDNEPINSNYLDGVEIVVKIEDVSIETINEERINGNTQEIADAITQPTDTADILNLDSTICNSSAVETIIEAESGINTQNDNTRTVTESIIDMDIVNDNDISSPFKDDVQRKQDFVNNTIEISPIKTLSPNNNTEKSQSPDNVAEDLIITLSTPVNINGESVENDSPELLLKDKISPDKREHSPIRTEIKVNNTSPVSCTSLKKSRSQVRGGGRGAQMLRLCLYENKSLVDNNEEINEINVPNTPAKRNLQNMCNSSTSDKDDMSEENESKNNFLKLSRILPALDSSPAGPILKRKVVDIIEDITISPAGKRKRVSFHDPPVSTTVAVQKYINPNILLRSPQNSAQKLRGRKSTGFSVKSTRKLDTVFNLNLNTVLNKAAESFNDSKMSDNNVDTQMTSLEETPRAEIVITSNLNDTEPICVELVSCKDSIENITEDLSSADMRSLLVKELEGAIETIGDLAKLTEVEVNRLCIKAPKIQVAKKALNDYYLKFFVENNKDTHIEDTDSNVFDLGIINNDNDNTGCKETQTDHVVVSDAQTQSETLLTEASIQTDDTSSSTAIQTDKPTEEIINSISENEDFFEKVMKNIGQFDPSVVLTSLLKNQFQTSNNDEDVKNRLKFIRDYLKSKFKKEDLIYLICADLLSELRDV